MDTPDALKAAVGKDRISIRTEDDEATVRSLRERFAIEATSTGGGPDVPGRGGGGVRAPPLRRARRRRSRRCSIARPTLDDVFMRYTGRTIRDAEASTAEQLMNNPMIRARKGTMSAATTDPTSGASHQYAPGRRASTRARPGSTTSGRRRVVWQPGDHPLLPEPHPDRHVAGPADPVPVRARHRARNGGQDLGELRVPDLHVPGRDRDDDLVHRDLLRGVDRVGPRVRLPPRDARRARCGAGRS